MKKINNKIYQNIAPHTQTVAKIMELCGLQDGRQWKCSNSAKFWYRNLWYHTKRVSGRLDHKTKKLKNCWKKNNYFPCEGGGGGVFKARKGDLEATLRLFDTWAKNMGRYFQLKTMPTMPPFQCYHESWPWLRSQIPEMQLMWQNRTLSMLQAVQDEKQQRGNSGRWQCTVGAPIKASANILGPLGYLQPQYIIKSRENGIKSTNMWK